MTDSLLALVCLTEFVLTWACLAWSDRDDTLSLLQGADLEPL